MNVSTNPKKAFGTKKPGVHFIPPVAILEEAVVMALGAAKYGPFNWVKDPVDATTYIDAIDRHLKQWQTGEDNDVESGASHLAHIRACCAILLDAQAIGNLIDDRSKGTASATATIDRLKKEEKPAREAKFYVGQRVKMLECHKYETQRGVIDSIDWAKYPYHNRVWLYDEALWIQCSDGEIRATS